MISLILDLLLPVTAPDGLEAIGYVQSPFKQKFAVPRQPGLCPSVRTKLVLTGKANCVDTVRGLDQFSHIWVLFLFDKCANKDEWSQLVRPPRLGGNQKIGVFATRSTYRPNFIGMSVVDLRHIEMEADQVVIHVGPLDVVDGTPLIDIKPYLPYCDSKPSAIGGYAQDAPADLLEVNFETTAREYLECENNSQYKIKVIKEVLSQDPRPAYKKEKSSDIDVYGVHIFDLNVRFSIDIKKRAVTISKVEKI